MTQPLPDLKRRDFTVCEGALVTSGLLEAYAWEMFLTRKASVLMQAGRVVAQWPMGKR